MDLVGLSQWIYPNKCILCGKILSNKMDFFCHQCESHMSRHGMCKKCGKPYAPQAICPYCDEMPEEVTRIVSLFPYIDLYQQSVLRWKYKGIRKYGKGFAFLIAEELLKREGIPIDGIIPIPISPNRYEQRGFNQALDLANEISTLTHIPVYDILRRTKKTKPQSACTKKERHRNIRGTIAIEGTLPLEQVKNIALVDDIYTTGSTVRECIRILNTLEERRRPMFFFVITVCIGG